MNKIQKHLKKNISIKFSDLDQETIDYIDDSDLRWWKENKSIEEIINRVWGYDRSYLFINFIKDTFKLTVGWTEHNPVSLSEFQEAIGMRKTLTISDLPKHDQGRKALNHEELLRLPVGTNLLCEFVNPKIPKEYSFPCRKNTESSVRFKKGLLGSGAIVWHMIEPYSFQYITYHFNNTKVSVKWYLGENIDPGKIEDITPIKDDLLSATDIGLVTYEDFLKLPVGTKFTFKFKRGGECEVVKVYSPKQVGGFDQYLCSNYGRFGRWLTIKESSFIKNYTRGFNIHCERIFNDLLKLGKLYNQDDSELKYGISELAKETLKATNFLWKNKGRIKDFKFILDENDFEIINRREQMFEAKTIIKSITLKEIHKDILPEIGRQICDKLGTEYKELDGKIHLVKGLIPPVELSEEKIKELFLPKLVTKEWTSVKDSKAMKILQELKLIKTIEFECPEETIEDLFKGE